MTESKAVLLFGGSVMVAITVIVVAGVVARGEPQPPAPVSSCPPCPSATDNAKLREAHAMCDARAKEWERRARE